jgi:hypothetical protein
MSLHSAGSVSKGPGYQHLAAADGPGTLRANPAYVKGEPAAGYEQVGPGYTDMSDANVPDGAVGTGYLPMGREHGHSDDDDVQFADSNAYLEVCESQGTGTRKRMR